ncbi:hypothetical protein ABIE49_001943 [Bradyrhizobium sp. OAE829]
MAATVDLAVLRRTALRSAVQLRRYLAWGACSWISTFAPPTPQVRSVRLPPAASRGTNLCVDPSDHHMGSVGPMNVQEGQHRNKAERESESYSLVTASRSGSGRPSSRKPRRQRPKRSTARRAFHGKPSTRRARRGFLAPRPRSSSAGDGALISDAADMCYALSRACRSTGLICAEPMTECGR